MDPAASVCQGVRLLSAYEQKKRKHLLPLSFMVDDMFQAVIPQNELSH